MRYKMETQKKSIWIIYMIKAHTYLHRLLQVRHVPARIERLASQWEARPAATNS